MAEHQSSDEIAQRLREEHRFRFGFHEDGGEAPSLYTDAADLIEAQHAKNERLREALERIAVIGDTVEIGPSCHWHVEAAAIARAALSGSSPTSAPPSDPA